LLSSSIDLFVRLSRIRATESNRSQQEGRGTGNELTVRYKSAVVRAQRITLRYIHTMEVKSTIQAKDGLLIGDDDDEKKEKLPLRVALLREIPPLLTALAVISIAVLISYHYFHEGSNPPRTWDSCHTVVEQRQNGLSWSTDFAAHSPCQRTSESHEVALCTYAIYQGSEELYVFCDRRYYVRSSDDNGNKSPWIQLGSTKRGRNAPSIWQESSDCATLLGDDYDAASLKEECGISGDDDDDDGNMYYKIECSQDQWGTYLDCGRSKDDENQ